MRKYRAISTSQNHVPHDSPGQPYPFELVSCSAQARSRPPEFKVSPVPGATPDSYSLFLLALISVPSSELSQSIPSHTLFIRSPTVSFLSFLNIRPLSTRWNELMKSYSLEQLTGRFSGPLSHLHHFCSQYYLRTHHVFATTRIRSPLTSRQCTKQHFLSTRLARY